MATASFDEAALAQLYTRLERRVFNVVYRWVWNKDDAADLVQDAFAKLWSMRERVRPETASALVYKIAVNLASNKRRQRKVWSFVSLEGLQASARPLDDDVERRVRAAVDALPERLRRVVVLGELSGMTAKEIGAVLDIPEGTVASRRHHALAALRQTLGSLVDDTPTAMEVRS